MSKRPSIKDIAREVGVSPATVSNVLNGRRGHVSEETARRVRQVVQALDYRPNIFGRGLSSTRSDTLGLIVANIVSPLFSQAVSGVEAVASRFGYDVLLSNNREDESRETRSVQVLLDRQVDGVIFISSSSYSRFDAYDAVIKAKVPFVVINRLTHAEHGLHILFDFAGGARRATQHLIELGHTRIGCIHQPISGPTAMMAAKEKLAGFRETLSDYGLPWVDDWVRQGSAGAHQGPAVGYALGREILSGATRPTAIVCASDHLASGVIRAARDLKIRVPGDLAVTGDGDSPFAPFVDPPLTSVRQPMEEAGAHAAEALLNHLLKGGSLGGIIHLPCELVLRESSIPHTHAHHATEV